MAYYDEPLVDPTQDFDAQQLALTQQAARIKALRDRYAKPYTPDNSEVGGFTLSTGQRIPGRIVGGGWGQVAQAVAPLLADYTAGQQEKAMTGEQSALNQRIQADAIDQTTNFPQPTTKQTPLGPDQPTGSFTGDPQTIIAAINNIADPAERERARQAYTNQQSGNMKTETVQPDRSTLLSKSVAMMGNPLLRATAQQKLADQLIKDPERDEARAERAAKLASDIAEARRKQAEDLAYKRWQAQQHDETLRAIAEGNQEARRDTAAAAKAASGHNWTYLGPDPADPTKGLWADPHEPTKPPVQGPLDRKKPEAELKPLPAGEQKRWDDNTRLIGQINAIKGTSQPDATGMGKGSVIKYGGDVGAWLVNKWSTADERQRRAAIDTIGTLKVHDLTGASFAIKELPRYNQFIPLLTDTEEQVREKLEQLGAVAEMERDNVRQAAATQGYRSPEIPGPTAPQGNQPAPVIPPTNQVAPPTASPGGTGATGQTSLDVNQAAYAQAKAAYAQHKTATNKAKLDLAWADLQRVLPPEQGGPGAGIKDSVNAANSNLPKPSVMSNEERLAKYGIGKK